MALRDKAIKIGSNIQAQTIVHEVVSIVDKAIGWPHLGAPNKFEFRFPEGETKIKKINATGNESVLDYVVWNFHDQARKEQHDKNSDYNVELKVMLHPIPGKVLGTEYASCSELRKLLLRCPIVKEYYYQNQTDKPKKFSNKAWKTRREDWDLALPGMGIPLYNGLELTILDTQLLPLYPEFSIMVKYIPEFDSRVDHLSKDWVFRQYYREIEHTIPEILPDNLPELTPMEKWRLSRAQDNRIREIYNCARDKCKTSDGTDKIAECAKKLKSVLLSKEQLVENYLKVNNRQ